MGCGAAPACLVTLVTVLALSLATATCPPSCVCITTRDGLHKATCSSLSDLYKFTLRQKHHNINILDLSHNNITNLTHQLDRFTEVVTLDLSTNGFKEIEPFLYNSKKLVHLNLANNRIQELSLSVLPKSVSSLDLSNNLLRNVPTDLNHLKYLEHLEMEGNPLECSCTNILSRDLMLSKSILIDHIICSSPTKFKGISWLELKTKDVCRPVENEYENVMMDDQPLDKMPLDVGKYSYMLKSKPALAELDQGQTWVAYGNIKDDDDDVAFLRAKRQDTTNYDNIAEGSGESGTTSEPDHEETTSPNLSEAQLKDDEIMLNQADTTEDTLEGSGFEGSGYSDTKTEFENSILEDEHEPTTTEYKELYTNHVDMFLGRGTPQDTEIPNELLPKRPDVFIGPKDWYNSTSATEVVETITTTEKAVNEKILFENTDAGLTAATSSEDNKPVVNRTGTYVCVVIIVVLLVALIGFAIIKGQMRKRRDHRLMRQQKRDIEKASKEMVDMNKSLLGKPAAVVPLTEKKANGKYELVPTHETPAKKTENGNVTKNKHNNGVDKNKSSPRDNNQNREERPRSQVQLQNNEEVPEVSTEDPKKETGSLSSEDIFLPLIDELPHPNEVTESDISQPLMNGDHNADSDYLSPSREYVPVYSPDMSRVRIKMTETPKPKTPVLVTRSRSNAGDIIITPSISETIPKSTT